MKRIPRKLGLLLTSFAGIFGIRTPPEPDVIAQMEPARPRAAPAPPDPQWGRRVDGEEVEGGKSAEGGKR